MQVIQRSNKSAAVVVDFSPLARELPVEIWMQILRFLPDFKTRFSIASTCWTCELACLRLTRELLRLEHPSIAFLGLNTKFPRALRKSRDKYLQHQCTSAFFERRLIMDEACYFKREGNKFSQGSRILFHQQLLHADARGANWNKTSKLFALLPNRGKSLRIVTALHSKPNSLCVWEDRNYSYELSCGSGDDGEEAEIATSLLRHAGNNMLGVISTNATISLFRENEHTYKYQVVANSPHKLSFQPQTGALGQTVVLFSLASTSAIASNQVRGLVRVDLETLQDVHHFEMRDSVVDTVQHVNNNRFLLGLQNGSTALYDERMSKSMVILSPARVCQTYPPYAPIHAGNAQVFAFTNTSTGRLEMISAAQPQKRIVLGKSLSSICALAVLDHFVLAGDGLGATLWDSRSTREPLSTALQQLGHACPNLHLDSCKYLAASHWHDFAVGDYLDLCSQVGSGNCGGARFQSELELGHLEVAPEETNMFASVHQGGVALLYPKLNRKDVLPKRTTSPATSEDFASAEEHAKALRSAKRKQYLENVRMQKLAERKQQREDTKLRAEMRWNRKS